MADARNEISSVGTVRTFLRVGSCSEALCNVLDRAFDHQLKLEERASMPFAGGIMQSLVESSRAQNNAVAAAQNRRTFV